MTTWSIARYERAATYGTPNEPHDVEQAHLPPDLKQEVVHLAKDQIRSELWRFHLLDVEQERPAEAIPVLFIPSKQRAAVMRGGRADWFDAPSPNAAVTEWLNRGMREEAAYRSP